MTLVLVDPSGGRYPRYINPDHIERIEERASEYTRTSFEIYFVSGAVLNATAGEIEMLLQYLDESYEQPHRAPDERR